MLRGTATQIEIKAEDKIAFEDRRKREIEEKTRSKQPQQKTIRERIGIH